MKVLGFCCVPQAVQRERLPSDLHDAVREGEAVSKRLGDWIFDHTFSGEQPSGEPSLVLQAVAVRGEASVMHGGGFPIISTLAGSRSPGTNKGTCITPETTNQATAGKDDACMSDRSQLSSLTPFQEPGLSLTPPPAGAQKCVLKIPRGGKATEYQNVDQLIGRETMSKFRSVTLGNVGLKTRNERFKEALCANRVKLEKTPSPFVYHPKKYAITKYSRGGKIGRCNRLSFIDNAKNTS